MQHFTLDVEVHLTAQKAAQVFVDEVVRRVLSSVGGQVFFQLCALRALLRRRPVAQSQPAGLDDNVREHCFYRLGDQRLLLGAFGLGGVFETDNQLLAAITARHLLHRQEFFFVLIAVFVHTGNGLRYHEGKPTILVVILSVVLGGVCGG
ncbi:hypothetical protein D3C76_1278680 [compost metagenome]